MGYQISLTKTVSSFVFWLGLGGWFIIVDFMRKDNRERNSHMCVGREDNTVSSPALDMLLDEIRHLAKYV